VNARAGSEPLRRGCAKDFAKGAAKGLTCPSKDSKDLKRGYAHTRSKALLRRLWLLPLSAGPALNPFDPFDSFETPGRTREGVRAEALRHPFAALRGGGSR
jgi:hypothetical protein